MSTHCGKIESALTEEGMLMIQQAIMGDKMVGAKLGIRRSRFLSDTPTRSSSP